MDFLDFNDLIDALRENITQYLEVASTDDLQDLVDDTVESL